VSSAVEFARFLVDVARVEWPSLAAGAAVGVAASLVGVFVLLKREALVALAMPQIVAVGAAIGLRLGWPSLPPALGAVAIAVLLLVWSQRRGAHNWVLPSLYIAGLSFSYLVIANSGQHLAELQAVFTGIDVAVTPSQVAVAVPILIASGLVCAFLWRRWVLLSQASATAEAAGLKPGRWEIGFLCLLSIVLLMGTSTLGTIMVVAMLFLPAAAVLPWARRVPSALAGAAILSLLFLAVGFVCSVEWEWPLSQSVGGVGFAFLITSAAAARLAGR
jgi:ABC-type Mn2+/Zn2+ transport system permease subunit